MSYDDDEQLKAKQLYSAAARILETDYGRVFMAALLEHCEHEQPAMGTNVAIMSAKVAKQEIALTVKDWCWIGGGKKNWRRMEDEIDITKEIFEEQEEQTLEYEQEILA